MKILQKSNFLNGFFINDKYPSREWRLKLSKGSAIYYIKKVDE